MVRARLHDKTFHMSLFSGRYDHALQRYSLEKESMTDRRMDGQPESMGLLALNSPVGYTPVGRRHT